MSNLLALDQSSKVSGYAVFKEGQLIKYGHFSLTSSDLAERLNKVRENIINLVNEYDIDEIVFEDIQLQSNVSSNINTFKVLAEVFGVIYQLCAEYKIPRSILAPSSWRAKLGLKNGRGITRPQQKAEAKEYILNSCGLSPTEDEADAICIGLAYLLDNN